MNKKEGGAHSPATQREEKTMEKKDWHEDFIKSLEDTLNAGMGRKIYKVEYLHEEFIKISEGSPNEYAVARIVGDNSVSALCDIISQTSSLHLIKWHSKTDNSRETLLWVMQRQFDFRRLHGEDI